MVEFNKQQTGYLVKTMLWVNMLGVLNVFFGYASVIALVPLAFLYRTFIGLSMQVPLLVAAFVLSIAGMLFAGMAGWMVLKARAYGLLAGLFSGLILTAAFLCGFWSFVAEGSFLCATPLWIRYVLGTGLLAILAWGLTLCLLFVSPQARKSYEVFRLAKKIPLEKEEE